LPRVWELRHNLTADDAAYIALAEALDATLLTRDRRLAAASGHRDRIELV
jgi:predicted nucleic acid-binding protein